MHQIVWRVEQFAEIDSTNTWLAARAREGVEEGLVAVAAYQTAGRGRLDRRWEAPANTALLTSILLRPHLDLDDLQLAVAAVSLALRESLLAVGVLDVTLKWPNDLLVGGRKLAGVLGEIVVTDLGPAVIIGVGVNLTAHPSGATDVASEAGSAPEPSDLLTRMLDGVAQRRVMLDDPLGRANLRAEYEGALATVGVRVRVEGHRDTVIGLATGVDARGQLVVATDEGPLTVSAGDVVHLRPHEESA